MKLAEQYVQKQMRKHWGEPTEIAQEKISFVQMEVFLRGITEAHRLVGHLRTMELSIGNQ